MTQRKRRSEKTEKKMAKARREGELKAEIERKYKTFKNKKDFIVWVKGLMERMADKIDPMKGIAVLGMTPLIKHLIESTEHLQVRARKVFFGEKGEQILWGLGGVFGMWLGYGFQMLGELTPEEEEVMKKLDLPQYEIFQWVLSFAIAYLLVEHAGTLLGLLGEGMGNLQNIVGLMMGA